MPSVDILGKIAICGAAVTIPSCTYFYYKIQEQFWTSEFYRLSCATLAQNKKLIEALGPPINTRFLKLTSPKNFAKDGKAQISIPVVGSKRKGILHSKCTRQEDGHWKVDSLVLEMNNHKILVPLKE